MLGSAMYGLLLGLVFVVLTELAPQPIGSLAWWILVAAQLSWGARITWRRTKLPFATAAMVGGATGATLVASAILSGHAFPWLPIAWAVPVYGLMAAGPVCLLIESRVHRDDWLRWSTYMEHSSAFDIMLGRHIPDWRNVGRK